VVFHHHLIRLPLETPVAMRGCRGPAVNVEHALLRATSALLPTFFLMCWSALAQINPIQPQYETAIVKASQPGNPGEAWERCQAANFIRS